MPNPVIHVENLGKLYRIGERERYLALRDIIARTASAPFRLFRTRKASTADGDPTQIWALQNVSFEVRQGDVVGIIGRNGAGKTTLLKVLARVTKPTRGFVDVRGRMGSLLEVGTGFHPELTGRENVFLSGAVLGMSKAEIQRKFDEIVAFAEVEKFIDTPLKHYSSGMQMRLAFAVAAHLEPEILLVDEVLAVGDQQFQKKCLGKMSDVAKGGRTILFVSHNMGAITRLCGHGIWLENGRVKSIGPVLDVAAAYIRTGSKATGERRWEEASAAGNHHVSLRAARILRSRGHVASVVDMREQFQIEIEYEIRNPVSHLRVCVRVAAPDGTVVFTSSDDRSPRWDGRPRASGKYVSRCSFQATCSTKADTP